MIGFDAVLVDVRVERQRQHERWGEQNHRDGTGGQLAELEREIARTQCDGAFDRSDGTWRHILAEEVQEAFAESEPLKLRTELVQVAAVAIQWCEAIDRRVKT